MYQKEVLKALHRQEYTHGTATFRHKVILDIDNNGISLVQASIKYGVSATGLSAWLRTYRSGGIEALSITKKRGRPAGMRRPKKVQKSETELERLRREVQELKKYIHYYNNDRIKLRLKGKSPVQYRTLCQ